MSISTLEVEAGPAAPPAVRSRQWVTLLRATLHQWRGRIGLVIVAILLLIAIFGPLIAPHSPTAFVGAPNELPSSHLLFGADSLGRDVWSRFLNGGLSVIGLAAASTIVGVGPTWRRRSALPWGWWMKPAGIVGIAVPIAS